MEKNRRQRQLRNWRNGDSTTQRQRLLSVEEINQAVESVAQARSAVSNLACSPLLPPPTRNALSGSGGVRRRRRLVEKYKHQQMGRALGEGDDDDGSTVTAAANIALGTLHVKGGASLSASLVNLSASLSASSWAPVRLVGVDTTRGGDVSEGREGSLNYVLQSTAWRAGTGVSALGQTLSELAQEEDADAIVGGAAMATKTEEERMVDERLNRLDSGMTDVLTVAAWCG